MTNALNELAKVLGVGEKTDLQELLEKATEHIRDLGRQISNSSEL